MLNFDNQLIEGSTLYLKDISKTFGGTKALDSVELLLLPGEIHGLIGQNGSGKSTLIKILAGYHEPDKGGQLWINGESVALPIHPGEFTKYGMSFVHQDLGLVADLTVLENLLIGKLSNSSNWHINWAEERRRALKIFKKYKINIDINATIANIGPVQRAMLAIVRAVEDINSNETAQKKKRGLLVLDEPTVFLPKTEVNMLFRLVREISAEGISVLFVSHDIDEVKELTDEFTVLRDGKKILRAKTTEYKTSQIVEKILGEEVQLYKIEERAEEYYNLKSGIVADKIRGDLIKEISFNVHDGEILGITGLEGSGFEELPYLLFGERPEKSGTLKIGEKVFKLEDMTPEKAVIEKMALIPADRQNKGSIGELYVKENMLMQVLDKFNKYKLKLREMDKKSYETMEKFRVLPRDPNLNFSQLSGGNQQKVLMAKWMLGKSRLLILHEPTQGVDIGARQQIYKHIETAANSGAAVLCCSSDYEQLEQICNRVIVLVRGMVSMELKGRDITKARLAHLCYDSATNQ